MHTLIEEHYAHRIEAKFSCSNPEKEIEEIPFPVYAQIVDSLANNLREGTFDGDDCSEYLDEDEKVSYSGSWSILEPTSN